MKNIGLLGRSKTLFEIVKYENDLVWTFTNDKVYIIISVLPKGRSFTANSGTKAAILPKGLPLQTQEPRLQFY